MFNKDLFYELCEKYDVELSDAYGKPVIRVDGYVREITEDDVKNMLPRFQEYFWYDVSESVKMTEPVIEVSFVPDEFPIAC